MVRKGEKVQVSERALMQRINRVLAKDGERLHKRRGAGHHQDTGDFYIIDIRRNFLAQKDVDIETLGRKKGVLADWEALGAQNA